MRSISIILIGAIALSGSAMAGAADEAAVVARSKDGPCQMVVTGGGQAFSINVTGLVPGEPLTITSESEGEVLKGAATAAADGSYSVIDFPLVQGKSAGVGTFTVKGSRCTVKASYRWHE